MTAFTIGFLGIMIFTIALGIAAAIFVSFDAPASEMRSTMPKQSGFPLVRHINTDTIETVDAAGIIQRWEKSTQQVTASLPLSV